MRRLTLLTALSLGMLLFAAPAAQACGELVAAASGCSMAESMDGLPCSDSGRVSLECCVAPPAPDLVVSLSFDRATHQAMLESVGRFAESPSLLIEPPVAAPAACRAACDLDRYTLFSSFLL